MKKKPGDTPSVTLKLLTYNHIFNEKIIAKSEFETFQNPCMMYNEFS